jgi:hypothetical protein
VLVAGLQQQLLHQQPNVVEHEVFGYAIVLGGRLQRFALYDCAWAALAAAVTARACGYSAGDGRALRCRCACCRGEEKKEGQESRKKISSSYFQVTEPPATREAT